MFGCRATKIYFKSNFIDHLFHVDLEVDLVFFSPGIFETQPTESMSLIILVNVDLDGFLRRQAENTVSMFQSCFSCRAPKQSSMAGITPNFLVTRSAIWFSRMVITCPPRRRGECTGVDTQHSYRNRRLSMMSTDLSSLRRKQTEYNLAKKLCRATLATGRLGPDWSWQKTMVDGSDDLALLAADLFGARRPFYLSPSEAAHLSTVLSKH